MNQFDDYFEGSLEDMMLRLAEMITEYRAEKKAFTEKHKHLTESIKSLQNIITEEVLKSGKSVTVGNIKAEFVPQVKIKVKKAEEDERIS